MTCQNLDSIQNHIRGISRISMIVNRTYKHSIRRSLTPLDDPSGPPPVVNVTSFDGGTPPSILYVEHLTKYQYASPVAFSKHIFRLQPVHDLSQSVLDYQLTVSTDDCEVRNFTGVFGNHATFIEVKEPYTELIIESRSILSVSDLPKRVDLLHQPLTIPVIWMPWDRIMMNAYLQPPELPESQLFALAEYAMSFVKKNNYDIFEVLNDINITIYRDFVYFEGETSVYTTPYEILINRKGVCQDFATLFICLARLLNIPARYRMGYLHTGASYDLRYKENSHAWVEVYLPYIGWTGFDPTNGCLAEKRHIRVACGRNYADATPTTGTLFMAPTFSIVKEEMSASIHVKSLNLP